MGKRSQNYKGSQQHITLWQLHSNRWLGLMCSIYYLILLGIWSQHVRHVDSLHTWSHWLSLLTTHPSCPRKLLKVNNSLTVVCLYILEFSILGLMLCKWVIKAGISKLINNSIVNMLGHSTEAPNWQGRLGCAIEVVIPLSYIQEEAAEKDNRQSTGWSTYEKETDHWKTLMLNWGSKARKIRLWTH